MGARPFRRKAVSRALRRKLIVFRADSRERKRHEQALLASENRLRQSEERYRLLLQNSPLGILHYDRDLIVTYANERFEQIMHVPKGYTLGLDCNTLRDQSVVPGMRRALAGEVAHHEGQYVTTFAGVPLWVSMHCGPVRDINGVIIGGVVLLEDITARKRIEEEQRRQREQLALAASVFLHAHEGILICDGDQVVVDVNPTFSEITGYERDDIIGKTPRLLASGRHAPEFYQAMWQAIGQHGHWQGEVWNRRKDGSIYAERLTISRITDGQGRVTHYIGTFSDISQLKLHQEELEQLAHYDPLTHLPNRALLSDRMEQALARARRNRTMAAVCYLDLDGFKAVNDELGHKAGDAVLVEIGHRLKDMVRASDTVARLGGDEFVLLLDEVDGRAECEQVVTRILRAICAPVRYKDQQPAVSGSIGIALFPEAGTDADTLLRHADRAMYTAKESGKNRHVFFDAALRNPAGSQELAETRLRAGLNTGELRLYYQPIVDMRNGSILRFEGLIRWLHPEHGMLLPADFLHVTESAALDIDLDRWVLDEGLRQLARWRHAGIGQGLNVNVSSSYLLSTGFSGELETMLARHPELEPGALELEILESAATTDTEAMIAAFERCHALGVTIALDDFGSGNSSLSFFRRMPVDAVKIDQVFVQSVLGSAEDLMVIESVTRLTHAFNRRLVAEGVESVEIGMLLLNLGCHAGQGFAIARPMPPEDVPAWMASYKPDRNWALPVSHVAREDMPLFLATLEHRQWVRSMEAWIAGDPDTPEPPPLDHGECRFGKWLVGPGRERYRDFDAYDAIEQTHEAVHQLGRELAGLCAGGRRDEARRRLGEMRVLRDRLVACLSSLQGKAVREKAKAG